MCILYEMHCMKSAFCIRRNEMVLSGIHDFSPTSFIHIILSSRLLHLWCPLISLHWRHNERNGVLNHQPHVFFAAADQRKHQSSSPLPFVRGIHRWPLNSPHKWPVTRKMFPFDDVIIYVVVNFLIAWKIHVFSTFYAAVKVKRLYFSTWNSMSCVKCQVHLPCMSWSCK